MDKLALVLSALAVLISGISLGWNIGKYLADRNY